MPNVIRLRDRLIGEKVGSEIRLHDQVGNRKKCGVRADDQVVKLVGIEAQVSRGAFRDDSAPVGGLYTVSGLPIPFGNKTMTSKFVLLMILHGEVLAAGAVADVPFLLQAP